MDFKFPPTATIFVPLNDDGVKAFEDFWERIRDGQQQPLSAFPALGPKNAQGQFEMPFFRYVQVFGGYPQMSAENLQSHLTGGLHIKV